ncbi:MAG TPA: F0F1 ATP synthase subunit B [Alphaproteobacteria bacterium]|nr:F0F1 ATP synthase subunit B [Alphaproteobacteria bacterium]
MEAHDTGLLGNATVWTAIAFVIFVLLAFNKIRTALTGMLDARSAKIRSELEEAARLREEAQNLLAEYQRKQRDALKEAEDIVAHARDEAARLRAEDLAKLEQSLQRRETQAMDKIAQAEAQAMQEVRDRAVEIAISATRRLLAEQVQGASASRLVDQAIAELPTKLH